MQFELEHVHKVYQLIANDFSRTRHSTWPFIDTFLLSLPSVRPPPPPAPLTPVRRAQHS